jgi:hypothetical protein
LAFLAEMLCWKMVPGDRIGREQPMGWINILWFSAVVFYYEIDPPTMKRSFSKLEEHRLRASPHPGFGSCDRAHLTGSQ